jgi:cell division protein FtsI (penicillin-binding protein 3)
LINVQRDAFDMKPRNIEPDNNSQPSANYRLKMWYGVLIFVFFIFIAKLFYLQVIRYDHYRQQALNDQLKEYSIDADRGIIEAQDGSGDVPIVLNEKLYTLYADPTLVKNLDDTAGKLSAITGDDVAAYQGLLKTKNTRYVILASRLINDQKSRIEKLRLSGVGLQAKNYRTYPQGSIASQLLGFVNTEGKGTYGVEQYLNKELAGTPGQLKAITDADGVPLAAGKNNIQIEPKNGDGVVLTVDLRIQQQVEKLLKEGLDNAKSKSGSAIVIDPNSGAIKAMANWPSYDPTKYFDVKDSSVFNNAVVSSPLEVGSVMKTLTTAAALDQGVITPNTSYTDPGKWVLDGSPIVNVEGGSGSATRSITEVLQLSLNTGATWMLMQMGGQTGVVNQKARDYWHDYMVNHYRLGKTTGVEQGYEASGYIPSPDKGFGLQLTYANTAFGQAMTATLLQMTSALSSVINGGTYYQPHLVAKTIDSKGISHEVKAKVLESHAVSAEVGNDIQNLMESVVKFQGLQFSSSYIVGGKTGTAQIANPAGGYYADKYNGTYIGFVGGDKPEYVIMVRVNEPGISGFAGMASARPIFSTITHMLIDNIGVAPKSTQ